MSPEANLMVLGVSAELAFMKDTLDKLGMEADFVHVGSLQVGARTHDPHRGLGRQPGNDHLHRGRPLRGPAGHAGRLAASVDRQRWPAWIDQGMFDAAGRPGRGPGRHRHVLRRAAGRATSATRKSPTWPTTAWTGPGDTRHEHTVAVVIVTGVIMPGTSRFDNFQGKIAGSETVVEQLQSVGEDEDIDAVILRVDSPGGSALASDLIWHEIQRGAARTSRSSSR